HAEYLARNLPDHPGLDQREESPDLPGYTKEGHRVATRALISPVNGSRCADAVDPQMAFPINRAMLLNPSLERVGLGRAAVQGGSAWVIAVDNTLKRVPGAPVVL